MSLEYVTILEYLWIDGNGELRSKTRVLNNTVGIYNLESIPIWNYDGSSTSQASSDGNTEVILVPCKYFRNPLINTKVESFIVLCETYDTNMIPLLSNHRHNAVKIFHKKEDEKPWFGIEQEYVMIHTSNNNENKCLSNDGKHYCGTQLNSIERLIAEEHMVCCLKAGIKCCGLNAEVLKSQWEFQVGICGGIDAADHLIVARFLLERIAEKYNVIISYYPKLYIDKNGTGCHTNFSTAKTRSNGGIDVIYKYMKSLKEKHSEHIAVYGEHNDKRLTGMHETSSYCEFTFGIGTRNTSVRIPSQVASDGYGYFEDRRPAGNCDPYKVTAMIFQTCCIDNT